MANDHSTQEGHVIVIVDGKQDTITPPRSGYGELTLKWVKGRITTRTNLETTRYGEGDKK